MAPRMRASFTESERRSLVREWRRSGLSATAFSEGRNFHATTLYGWLRRYGSAARPSVKLGFVEAIPSPAEPRVDDRVVGGWQWELVGPGGCLRGAGLGETELEVLVEAVARRVG